MQRYSGLFLEVDELNQLFELYPRIFFISGEQDSLEDNTLFYNEIQSACVFYVIPQMAHFGYFSKSGWSITNQLYQLIIRMYIPIAKL